MTADPHKLEHEALADEVIQKLPHGADGSISCFEDDARKVIDELITSCMQHRGNDIANVFGGLAADVTVIIDIYDKRPCLALVFWTGVQTLLAAMAVSAKRGFFCATTNGKDGGCP